MFRDLLFVSAGLDLDGGGRALAGRLLESACAEYARARGLRVSVLALGSGGGPEGTRYFGTDQRRLAVEVWRRQLRDGLRNRRPIVVFDLLGPARIQAWLPARLRAPYLIPLYGIEVWRPLSWERRRAMARATVRFAISRHTIARALPFAPGLAGPPETPVVPLALEERQAEGAVDAGLLRRLGLGYMLIVGRMASGERYKGHEAILQSMLDLPESRLVVAGEGDDRSRLAARAADLGLARRVTFTGFVSEATLLELYRRAALFVMPSLGEGFGLVYLEAMRAGKPCVAARGSAAEEVVVHGQTGLLASPGELTVALRTFLDSPETARRMGEAGRRRWRDELNAGLFRSRVAPLLDRLLETA